MEASFGDTKKRQKEGRKMRRRFYLIEFEWKITRTDEGWFNIGKSCFKMKAKSKLEIINAAIEFAEQLPSWEYERNGVDIKRFIKDCRVMYTTQLTKIVNTLEFFNEIC